MALCTELSGASNLRCERSNVRIKALFAVVDIIEDPRFSSFAKLAHF